MEVKLAYAELKSWWKTVDAGLFSMTAISIIIIYLYVKYHELQALYPSERSLKSLLVAFLRPYCDYTCREVTSDGTQSSSRPTARVSSMFHLFTANYIFSSVFKTAPEAIKSNVIHFIGYLTGIDSDDAVCMWTFLLAATPILVFSFCSSIVYSFIPSFIIQYGSKVIEIAMIVDYIISPLLIPIGSNWPIILLLLINYAVYISLEQCDNKIRWSKQQQPSTRRQVVLYIAYPIIMTMSSYFIANSIVYDAYYYARLYHVI
jgi:hypothetical protein